VNGETYCHCHDECSGEECHCHDHKH
jgi:hypothetical protein